MKTIHDKCVDRLEQLLNRPAADHEKINVANDALLLAQILKEEVEDLQNRVELLEKKAK